MRSAAARAAQRARRGRGGGEAGARARATWTAIVAVVTGVPPAVRVGCRSTIAPPAGRQPAVLPLPAARPPPRRAGTSHAARRIRSRQETLCAPNFLEAWRGAACRRRTTTAGLAATMAFRSKRSGSNTESNSAGRATVRATGDARQAACSPRRWHRSAVPARRRAVPPAEADQSGGLSHDGRRLPCARLCASLGQRTSAAFDRTKSRVGGPRLWRANAGGQRRARRRRSRCAEKCRQCGRSIRLLSISGPLLGRSLTMGMFRHRTYTEANSEASRRPDEETP